MYTQKYFRKHTDHYLKKDLGQIPSFAWIKKEADFSPGERILDAGCGTGYLLNFLVDGEKCGVGVDISASAIKLARKRFSHLRFFRGDLSKLPFKDGEFDKVVCFNVIEHLEADEQERALEEIKRVLRKGGVLVAGTNIKNSLSWQLFKLFFGGDPTHTREFNSLEFIDFIGRYFEVEKSTRSSCIARFSGPINAVFHRFLKGDILVKGVKR